MLPVGRVRNEKHGEEARRARDQDDDQDHDPGKGGLHHVQHDCSTFAAEAAKNRNAETVPASETDTVSSCVQEKRSFFAADMENTQTSPHWRG